MRYLFLLLLMACSKQKDDYCKYDTPLKYEHYEWDWGPVYPTIKLDSVQSHHTLAK
jgi:hypothetical protein